MLFLLTIAIPLLLALILLHRSQHYERDLSGQVVLLTGAGGGFGRSLALTLARRGCVIACVDVAAKPNEDTVALVLKQQKQHRQQPGAKAYAADLTKSEDIANLVSQVIKDFGHVDILVSNAGQLQGGAVWDLSEQQVDLILDVNLRATILLVRALVPHMKSRRRGHIVAVSSMSAVVSAKLISVYGATKAGLSHYMQCLYHDLHHEGLHNNIHLTTIQPYFMRTYHVLSNTVFSKRWIGKQLLQYLDPQEAAEVTVRGIAQRRQSVNITGHLGNSFLLYQLLPLRAQAFLEKTVFGADVRPIISYQYRHREMDPEYLHELLSKGYPLADDPHAICQRLDQEYITQGKRLPHDFAQFADQIVAFYKSLNKTIPPAVRGVFDIAV